MLTVLWAPENSVKGSPLPVIWRGSGRDFNGVRPRGHDDPEFFVLYSFCLFFVFVFGFGSFICLFVCLPVCLFVV